MSRLKLLPRPITATEQGRNAVDQPLRAWSPGSGVNFTARAGRHAEPKCAGTVRSRRCPPDDASRVDVKRGIAASAAKRAEGGWHIDRPLGRPPADQRWLTVTPPQHLRPECRDRAPHLMRRPPRRRSQHQSGLHHRRPLLCAYRTGNDRGTGPNDCVRHHDRSIYLCALADLRPRRDG